MRISNRQGKIVNGPIRYHVVFWGVVFGVILFASLAAHASLKFSLGLSLSLVVLVSIPVYVHFYPFERFLSRRGYIRHTILTAAIVIGFAPPFYVYPPMQRTMGLPMVECVERCLGGRLAEALAKGVGCHLMGTPCGG